MAERKKPSKTVSQTITDPRRVDALGRLAGRLDVATARVLDELLTGHRAYELAGIAQARAYAADSTLPVPVLLDGAVVAAMAGAITNSVSTLLGNALPDLVLAVLAHQAERRPELLAGTVEPILNKLVPQILDRLIAEQDRIDL